MFASLVALVSVFSASAVLAVPNSSGNCKTGSTYCCDTTQPSWSDMMGDAPSIFAVPIQDFNLPIGADCIPINYIGAGNAGTCTNTPVCCSGSGSTGTIATGCNAIPINL